MICSNDPICADHHPGDAVDERALQGAACHGCLLVSETSCERRNNYLDRALLVEMMATNDASLPSAQFFRNNASDYQAWRNHDMS